MPKINGVEGDFSDEGLEMWNNLDNPKFLEDKFEKTIPKKKKVEENIAQLNRDSIELRKIRLEIEVLRQNSMLVLQNCKENIDKFVKKEQYREATIQRVVGFVHKNFESRLNRILNGLPAIESIDERESYNDIDNIKL